MTETAGAGASPATGPEVEEHAQLVAEVAARLGEREEQPLKQIKRAVRVLGPERVRAVLAQALEVERQGGLMTNDGSRRRTPGGVFFYLLRQGLHHKERRIIFGWTAMPPQRGQAPADAE